MPDDTEAGPPAPQPPARQPRRRRILPIVLIAVGVLVIGSLGAVAYYALSIDRSVTGNIRRADTLPSDTDPSSLRPSQNPQQSGALNYVLLGSDSRDPAVDTNGRSDSIMVVHLNQAHTLAYIISFPRDMWVTIPGYGKNKINAAYAFGGPQLLVRTVEQATGLHVDSYVETGLGGYARLVDAVGGIDVCVKRALKDPKAHINVKAGCQTFDGPTALGYARARYADPRGDLGRVERQRQVLAAIAGKTLSPSVVALPWRAFPAASAGAGALTVDRDMSPTGLLAFVQAMRAVAGGGGLSLTVPVANAALQTPNAGEAVQWNSAQAGQLFDDLRRDDTNAIKPLADAQKKATG